MGTRLTIDSLTCLLANETDPSRLVAVSPGKLVRYLVADGAHVKKDQPYVEIEVCLLSLRCLLGCGKAPGSLHVYLCLAKVA